MKSEWKDGDLMRDRDSRYNLDEYPVYGPRYTVGHERRLSRWCLYATAGLLAFLLLAMLFI